MNAASTRRTLLLSRGADATLKDTRGDTALTHTDGEEEIEDQLRAGAT